MTVTALAQVAAASAAQAAAAVQPSALWDNPILWSGVIAASIALFGVIAPQVTALWLNARQQKQDRNQRALERQMHIRRKVYLEGAAGVSNISTMMGTYANVQIENVNLPDAFAATAARIQVVGSERTVQRSLSVLTAFINFITKFSVRRMELRSKQSGSEGWTTRYCRFRSAAAAKRGNGHCGDDV
jgi:hypothetical protein